MLVKLKVSAKVDGEWKNPGSLVELPADEAKRMFRLKAADRPSQVDLPANSNTYSAEEMDEMISALTEIDGISEKLVGDVIEAGYITVKSIAEASDADLVAIKGIGQSTALRMIESAEGLSDS